MRRRLTWIVALVIALTTLSGAASAQTISHYLEVPASRSESGTTEWWPVRIMSDGDAQVTDPFCGTDTAKFRLVIYSQTDFRGDHVVLCRSQSDFCSVPFKGMPLQIGCWTGNAINDNTYSISMGEVYGNSTCVRIHEHVGYEGLQQKLYEYQLYPLTPKVGGHGSSLRKLPAINC